MGYAIAFAFVQFRWLYYRLHHPAGSLDPVGAAMAVLAAVITGILMFFIKENAKAEQVKWLTVVSRILLVFMTVFAVGSCIALLFQF